MDEYVNQVRAAAEKHDDNPTVRELTEALQPRER